jgi:non-homologous end joining protein Ku
VPYEKIVSGYEVGKGQYIEVTDEELEAIALESTRTIDIDEFVPKDEIDSRRGDPARKATRAFEGDQSDGRASPKC